MVARGRPRWYKPDMGLAARMVLTMFLMGAVYVALSAVLWRLGLIPLIFFALVIAVVQLFFADKIALFAMGAKEVSEAEAPQLHDMIGRLALQADLPKPKVAIVNSSIPNAFATGRDKNHAVVAVTTGILSQLSEPELEGVLAHELTHILNRDMLVMTIATFFSMVVGLLMRSLIWTGLWGGGYGRRRDDNTGAIVMLALLASVVAYALSFLLVRALSRYRELAADRGAALITGAPQNLASALMRISNNIQNGGQSGAIPKEDFRHAEPVNALFIVPALRGDSLASLLSTHPSTEERVQRLMEMQKQMESAQYLS